MDKNKISKTDAILTFVSMILAFASVVTVVCFMVMGKNVVPTISLDDDTGRKRGYYTFLVAGTDTTSNNTDVLMLASLDSSSGDIKILQIPRDTFIDRTVLGYSSVTRVNGIFAAEYNKARNDGYSANNSKKRAMQALCTVVADALGTEIDEYVLIDTSAFRAVVNAVGGVYFDVPYDMEYSDPYQDLYIDIKAGYQLLDGEQAEHLIRFRGTPTADLGRIDVRADFIKTMAVQVKANLNLSSMITIAGELISKMTTSFSAIDAVKYISAAYDASMDDIEIKTLTGSSVWDPVQGRWSPSYYLNKAAACRDINKFANVYKKDIELNDFDTSGLFCDKSSTSAETYYKREDIQ